MPSSSPSLPPSAAGYITFAYTVASSDLEAYTSDLEAAYRSGLASNFGIAADQASSLRCWSSLCCWAALLLELAGQLDSSAARARWAAGQQCSCSALGPLGVAGMHAVIWTA